MAERNEEQGDVHDQKDLKEEKNRARFSSRYYSKRTRRSVCACISIFLLVIGVVALTLWLVYRPIDPQFTVVGAAIYDLNMSSLPLLSTTMQFTIVTRNPNRRVSIYYDRLTVFVSYRNQQITSQVILPPLAHEKRSTVAMSPVLGGGAVAVSLEVANGLVTDQTIGVLGLRVVLLGRLRWKAGPLKTGRYSVYVKCDVLVGVKRGLVGQLPMLASPPCKVDI
ncbi:NDR1/HIN1-like protein 12 [Cucumis sativus]|uniref:Late embryogenesis abundant protein LEA-2 subgroup domain-containing protein n=1 Tax=Cucumis sativus TaxID=3659 RepID=A0A0A0L882_CUCSA|nr:NDR1/HIN1-like protein 12 [Cucumis sativus]